MNAAQPARSRWSLSLRSLLGALWFGLWFFVVFPAGILWWSGQSWVLQMGMHVWLGAGLVAVAHLVLVVEVADFIRSGGTHVPFDPPPSLVGTGLYGRVRNPMYAAYVVIAIGEAVLYRSWALGGYGVLLAVFVHGYVVYVEEPGLRRRSPSRNAGAASSPRQGGAHHEEACERDEHRIPGRISVLPRSASDHPGFSSGSGGLQSRWHGLL